MSKVRPPVEMFTKKQNYLPPEEWVIFKEETGKSVPGAVSEELWGAANGILKRRSEDVKSRQGICNYANLFTGKLFCTFCGEPNCRGESRDTRGNKNSRMVCSGKSKTTAPPALPCPVREQAYPAGLPCL